MAGATGGKRRGWNKSGAQPESQYPQPQGEASSEGNQEQTEEGADRCPQGRKHRPDTRTAYWKKAFPQALDIALPGP